MFKTQHFYHQHVRKAIIAFGTLFNQIQVRRTNAQGEVVQSVFVPLSYAPKQKFIERIRYLELVSRSPTFHMIRPENYPSHNLCGRWTPHKPRKLAHDIPMWPRHTTWESA